MSESNGLFINTPRIDQMAKEGALFTNFYAGSTVCGPSRAALLTGLHTGHLDNCGNSQDSLSIKYPTWPNLLIDNGYHTGMFGKQHHAIISSDTVFGDSPVDRGFQEFVGHLNAGDAHQQFLDGKTNGWDRRNYLFKTNGKGQFEKHNIAPSRFTQNEFLEHGLDFINNYKDTTFFLYLPFTIAHAEMAIPKPGDPDHDPTKHSGLWEQYLDEDGNSIFPEFNYTGDKIYARPIPYKSRATFAAMISHLDRDIGRILDLLDELAIADNTMVILTSDNGPADEGGIDSMQIDGTIETPFNSNGGFTGFKRSLYEGGIRVPMIVWWPSKIEGGLVIDEFFANYDIGPTITSLTGSANITNTDGISFMPALQSMDQEAHDFLYWEWQNKQAVRLKDYKAIRYTNENAFDKVMLYNITRDPQEKVDLSTVPFYKGILSQAKRILNEQNSGSACDFVELAI